MHKKQVHKEPAQEMDPEDDTLGKQKIVSITCLESVKGGSSDSIKQLFV